MKLSIIALAVLISFSVVLAADTPPTAPTPQDVARQAIAAIQSRRVKESDLPRYIAVLEKNAIDLPSDPLIRFALASCYMGQNNSQAAITNMEIAYISSKKDAGIGMMYVFALKMNKQLLKAYNLSKELAASHPDLQQMQMSVATMAMSIQKYDEAISIFDPIQQQVPVDFPAKDKCALLLMQGTCYLYKGDHAKAIETLENARSALPKAAANLTVLGEAYLKNGDLDKASEALDQALAINHKIPAALYYRGIIYEKTGSSDLAQQSFQSAYANGKECLQDNGQDYFLMYLIGQKLGRNDESKRYRAEAQQLLFTFEAPWKPK